jgi:uncharacterized protein YxjI
VNQNAKVLELNTTYEIFGSDGMRLGHITQYGQSRAKHIFRLFTAFDQYFTHYFVVTDAVGRDGLKISRPAKIFRTKVHVWDGNDQFLGSLRQQNVFWKIRFDIVDAHERLVGHLQAENLRAWDFQVVDPSGRPLAEVVKSWEGWAQTQFTRADRYAIKVHVPLPDPLRQLTFAAALAVDLALKQDARGFG